MDVMFLPREMTFKALHWLKEFFLMWVTLFPIVIFFNFWFPLKAFSAMEVTL